MSLARTDANLTGITVLGAALSAKRLELLKGCTDCNRRRRSLESRHARHGAGRLGLEDTARALRVKLRGVEAAIPPRWKRLLRRRGTDVPRRTLSWVLGVTSMGSRVVRLAMSLLGGYRPSTVEFA